MTDHLLLFRNASAESGYLATTQDMAEDMPRWQAWIGNIAMQGKLVSTAPIVYEGAVVTEGGISHSPYKESGTILVTGYLIARADNAEEAEAWAKTCPILKYPGSSVEVRALLPFPV
jgi:hypothetical protein